MNCIVNMCVKLSWNKFKHVAEACILDVRALFDDDDRSHCLSAINKWKKEKKKIKRIYSALGRYE